MLMRELWLLLIYALRARTPRFTWAGVHRCWDSEERPAQHGRRHDLLRTPGWDATALGATMCPHSTRQCPARAPALTRLTTCHRPRAQLGVPRTAMFRPPPSEPLPCTEHPAALGFLTPDRCCFCPGRPMPSRTSDPRMLWCPGFHQFIRLGPPLASLSMSPMYVRGLPEAMQAKKELTCIPKWKTELG
jgi:hypothetical protein